MVKNSRETAGADGLLPLNLPRPAAITADERGVPQLAFVRGLFRPVAAVCDDWRIDDEWWRAEISRHYFELELDCGTRLTVFHDLVSGDWYEQQYASPKRPKGEYE